MRRFSISLASLFLTLAVVEAVVVPLELLVPSEFHDRRATLFGLFEPHPELGFRARPNLRDFEVSWRDNALTGTYSTDDVGFRNVGRDYAESEIFFIGDSFTWGVWVPREDTFPDLVGRELGVQISNLGQESYYIEQYHKVAREALGWGRPRRVVVCLFANDLTAPMSDADFENFYERFGWNQYRSYPLYKKTFIYQAAGFLEHLADRAAIASGLRPPPPPSHLDRRVSSAGMEFYRQLGVHPHYFSQSFHLAIEPKFRALLQEIINRDVEPVVFLLPSKESAYKDVYLHLFPGDYLEIEESAYGRLCEIADTLAVRCVDLTPAFRDRGRSVDTYFDRDPHWNREGHRVAAEEIVKYLH